MGEFCEFCKGGETPPLLDGILICANFDEGVLKEAIHQFKYNSISDIGGVLGRIMAGKIKSIPVGAGLKPALTFDLVVPVPLHKKRLRQRGFNQAEILASVICREMHFCLAKNILVRNKYTVPQMELDREQRLENLKDVFIVGAYCDVPIKEKNILLVDDVTTTGATLEECAKVLKNNGAKSVWAIVLAKGK
jgi:ComF family protein